MILGMLIKEHPELFPPENFIFQGTNSKRSFRYFERCIGAAKTECYLHDCPKLAAGVTIFTNNSTVVGSNFKIDFLINKLVSHSID